MMPPTYQIARSDYGIVGGGVSGKWALMYGLDISSSGKRPAPVIADSNASAQNPENRR